MLKHKDYLSGLTVTGSTKQTNYQRVVTTFLREKERVKTEKKKRLAIVVNMSREGCMRQRQAKVASTTSVMTINLCRRLSVKYL